MLIAGPNRGQMTTALNSLMFELTDSQQMQLPDLDAEKHMLPNHRAIALVSLPYF